MTKMFDYKTLIEDIVDKYCPKDLKKKISGKTQTVYFEFIYLNLTFEIIVLVLFEKMCIFLHSFFLLNLLNYIFFIFDETA